MDSALSTAAYRLPAGPYSELIDGEVVTEQPSEAHELFTARIRDALSAWTGRVRARGEAMSSMRVILDDHNAFSPDVAYFRRDHVPGEGAQSVAGPPPGFALPLDDIFAPRGQRD